MKRTLLLIIALVVIAFQVNAQNDTIPNPSYERWLDDIEQPVDWSSTNPWIALAGGQNVFKDSDAYDGDYAVELTTVIVQVGPFNVPGLITLGTVAVNLVTTQASIEGGIPWTSKPDKLKGYYKYAPADGDSCGIVALFTRFIPAKGKRDTLGIGRFYSTQTAEEWTEFSMNINFFSAEMPDSMNIIVSSSASLFDPLVGSTLWVDAFEYEGSSGIGLDIIPSVRVSVYPNPAQDYLTFAFEKPVDGSELIIYNLDGQMVKSDLINGKEKTLQVGELPAGTYYFHLLDGGTRISSGSFLVGE